MTTEKTIDFAPLPAPDYPKSWGGLYSAQQMRDYVAQDRAQRQAEPVAWAVYWGIGQMRKNSVHFERKTAEEVAAHIKSATEIRPLYTAAPPPAQVPEFLFDGARFKLSFNGQGNCTTFRLMEHGLQGRWVALVDATDGRHLAAAPDGPLMNEDTKPDSPR